MSKKEKQIFKVLKFLLKRRDSDIFIKEYFNELFGKQTDEIQDSLCNWYANYCRRKRKWLRILKINKIQ